PYFVDRVLQGSLVLDATGSFDPDQSCNDRIVKYRWDLDGNGTFDFQFDNAGNRDRIYNLISQKVVDGYFHILLMVELPPGSGFAQLKATLECMGGPDDYVVRVMHERVFRFMHRV
ncbi:MAG: hypothetical protein NTV21_17800, partial [Planctomycetota bacterium]|nr:hypothetical protein [Planctomycetota bacterium]